MPRRRTRGGVRGVRGRPGRAQHRHGLRWSAAPFEAWSAPHPHLLTAYGERSFVALDGERLAGFSAALAGGDTWFLAALFVSPDDQGRRVGRELLDRSWAGDWQRRMKITESIQPVSTGMYARRGLISTTSVLTLSGTPRRVSRFLRADAWGEP